MRSTSSRRRGGTRVAAWSCALPALVLGVSSCGVPPSPAEGTEAKDATARNTVGDAVRVATSSDATVIPAPAKAPVAPAVAQALGEAARFCPAFSDDQGAGCDCVAPFAECTGGASATGERPMVERFEASFEGAFARPGELSHLGIFRDEIGRRLSRSFVLRSAASQRTVLEMSAERFDCRPLKLPAGIDVLLCELHTRDGEVLITVDSASPNDDRAHVERLFVALRPFEASCRIDRLGVPVVAHTLERVTLLAKANGEPELVVEATFRNGSTSPTFTSFCERIAQGGDDALPDLPTRSERLTFAFDGKRTFVPTKATKTAIATAYRAWNRVAAPDLRVPVPP